MYVDCLFLSVLLKLLEINQINQSKIHIFFQQVILKKCLVISTEQLTTTKI